jgi:hypothetical protein
MPTMHIPYDQKALVTIVGARIGEKAFGVSAGDAEVMATIRATSNSALEALVKNVFSVSFSFSLFFSKGEHVY